MTRIMHLADIHLGAKLTGLDRYPGAPDVDPVQAPYDAFHATIDRALGDRYDAVLIAGDVFDRAGDADRTVATFQEAIDLLHQAGVPVAMIAGNHDAEVLLLDRLRLPASATLLPVDRPATVVWDELGIAVHGQSIGEKDDLRDLVAGYPAAIPSLMNVAMLHTSLGGEWSNRACAPTTIEALEATDHDYWALGHVHERRAVAGSPLAAYPGSLYGRKAGESGGHGYLEVDIDARVTTTPVDTASVRYHWLSLAAEEAIISQFSSLHDLEDGAVVVWTPDREHTESELAAARELAAGYPNYLVAPGRADLIVGPS